MAADGQAWEHPSQGAMGLLLTFRLPEPPAATRQAMLSRRRHEFGVEAASATKTERWRPQMPRYRIRPTTRQTAGRDEVLPPTPPHSAIPRCPGTAPGGDSLPAVRGRIARQPAAAHSWRVVTTLSPTGKAPPIDPNRPHFVTKRDRWQDLMLQREQMHDVRRGRTRDRLESMQALYSSFSPDGVYSPHKSKCNRLLYNVPMTARETERPKWVTVSASPRRSPREPHRTCGPPPRVLNTRLRQLATPQSKQKQRAEA